MPVGRQVDRGRHRGALFVSAALLLPLFLSLTTSAEAGACKADRVDAEVRVAAVLDGDTVVLEGGERLRLVGFNTPELARDDRPAEPLAEVARQELLRVLRAQRMTLLLRRDVDHRDRHGRLLAHAFLSDGESVAEHLLRSGLGMAAPVADNLWQTPCYSAAELSARRAGTGVWAHPAYRPLEATQAPGAVSGFRLVRGRVSRLERVRGGLRIWLDEAFVAWVRGPAVARFEAVAGSWVGRRVELRGWLRYWRGRPEIGLGDPVQVSLLQGAE